MTQFSKHLWMNLVLVVCWIATAAALLWQSANLHNDLVYNRAMIMENRNNVNHLVKELAENQRLIEENQRLILKGLAALKQEP